LKDSSFSKTNASEDASNLKLLNPKAETIVNRNTKNKITRYLFISLEAIFFKSILIIND
jgi:hypothetical protein